MKNTSPSYRAVYLRQGTYEAMEQLSKSSRVSMGDLADMLLEQSLTAIRNQKLGEAASEEANNEPKSGIAQPTIRTS